MKTATIRQIRNDFATVLEWIAAGEEVTITNRRRPVARLLPPRPSEAKPVQLPDFMGRLKREFGGRQTTAVQALGDERAITMVTYLDSSVIVSLYLPDSHSKTAAEIVAELAAPLLWMPLHRLEVTNAVRLALFRKEITTGQAARAIGNLRADENAGILHSLVPVWSDVFDEAEQLSDAHSPGCGCRGLDILHIATASALKLRRFLTFDHRQENLAKRAGFAVS